jgi:hypothetical protein
MRTEPLPPDQYTTRPLCDTSTRPRHAPARRRSASGAARALAMAFAMSLVTAAVMTFTMVASVMLAPGADRARAGNAASPARPTTFEAPDDAQAGKEPPVVILKPESRAEHRPEQCQVAETAIRNLQGQVEGREGFSRARRRPAALLVLTSPRMPSGTSIALDSSMTPLVGSVTVRNPDGTAGTGASLFTVG